MRISGGPRRRDFIAGVALSAGTALWPGLTVARDKGKATVCDSGLPSQPWKEFGINIVGPALSPGTRGTYAKDYIYPDDSSFAYYRSKGFRVASVTFLWERLQPKLFAELDVEEAERLQVLIEKVRDQNMALIIGPHNYARYAVKDGFPELIGSEAVPVAAFIDFWRRVAIRFATQKEGLIFTLMNEPHDTKRTWTGIAQDAVNAIREVDKERWIYVPGDGWSSARSWREFNEDLVIADSSDRLVYVAHQYFDGSAKGVYEKSYDEDRVRPEIAVNRLRPFLDWLRRRGLRGTVTEYGVPNDDSRWLTVLDSALNTLKQAGVGGAYWAGGPWWGDYPLSSEPRDGKDAPVMSVLIRYVNSCSAAQSE
jgi:endoglucanase